MRVGIYFNTTNIYQSPTRVNKVSTIGGGKESCIRKIYRGLTYTTSWKNSHRSKSRQNKTLVATLTIMCYSFLLRGIWRK
jgi:hypothetical protein